jgi:hypothetical protein
VRPFQAGERAVRPGQSFSPRSPVLRLLMVFGNRRRRLDHVTRQRNHQVGKVNPGRLRPATARPRRSAPRAVQSLRGLFWPPPHWMRALPPQRGQDTAVPPASIPASLSGTTSESLRASATSPSALRSPFGLRQASRRPNSVGSQRGIAGLVGPRKPQHTSLACRHKDGTQTLC